MLDDDLFDDIPEGDPIAADQRTRLANYLIDLLAVSVLTYGLIILLFNTGVAGEIISKPAGLPLLFTGVYFIYYLLCEVTTHRSLGKVLTGTIVIAADASKLTFSTAFVRTLCRLIPFEPLSFIGEHRWHDRISKTTVVYL